MKNIGIKLKEKREENGVSIEEAAEDLKLRVNQIIDIENGNKSEVEDIIVLKKTIKDYAKYLGLDAEELVDEFNEYLFDYTSKIPVEIIEKAKQEKQEEKKDFISPYTTTKDSKKPIMKFAIIFGIVFVAIISSYIVIKNQTKNNLTNETTIYLTRRN